MINAYLQNVTLSFFLLILLLPYIFYDSNTFAVGLKCTALPVIDWPVGVLDGDPDCKAEGGGFDSHSV